jgi:hypothetical protein
MEKGNNKQTEKFLKNFSFKPAPSALKQKILNDVLRQEKTNNGRIDYLLKGLVGCSVLLILAIAIDATITHAQNKRFSSILQKEQESIDLTEEERAVIEDILGKFMDSTKIEANMQLYDFLKKKKNKRRQAEWRESLKKEIE